MMYIVAAWHWFLALTPLGKSAFAFYAPPLGLAVLYPVAVQYDRGRWWCPMVLPFTLVALVLDVFANFTSLAIITWDFPHPGEYTFTQRLRRRLKFNTDWRGTLARGIAAVLNFIKPGHV